MKNKSSKYVKTYSHYVISGIISAILFVIMFLIIGQILFPVIVSVAVFIALVLITQPRYKIGGIDVDKVKNGQEIQDMISEGYNDLEEIGKQRVRVFDVEMRKKVENVYNSAAKIVDYIEKNPEKANQARRFFTYYIDITAKILKKYNDFVGTGFQNPEITKVIDQTSKALDILEKTYETILIKLIQNDVMDMEIEVNLLENMLKAE